MKQVLETASSKILTKFDWAYPGVKELTATFDLFPSIDSVVLLYRPPKRSDGSAAWLEEDIDLEVSNRLVEISEFEHLRPIATAWQRNHKKEARGVRYCVEEVECQTGDSGGKLTLKVRPIEYHVAHPVALLLAQSFCGDGESGLVGQSNDLRAKHYANLLERHRPLQPNMLIPHVTVISADRQLLLFKRRATGLAYSRECWSAGLEEHCNADYRKYIDKGDVFPMAKHTDRTVFDAFRRTLREELKLSYADILGTELRVLGFGFEFENFDTGAFAIARVPLSADEILSNNSLKSGEEHDRFGYCPFRIPSLLPVLRNKTARPRDLVCLSGSLESKWNWEPTARMRILLGLYDEFGEEEVEQSLKRSIQWEGRQPHTT